MDYATNYDVGERKRGEGINEDSIAISVFEQGHREGYRGMMVPVDDGTERAESDQTTVTEEAEEAGDADAAEDAGTSAAERVDEPEEVEEEDEEEDEENDEENDEAEDEASASQESVAESIEQIEQSLEEPTESEGAEQDDVKIFSPDETATLGDEDGSGTENDSETSADTASEEPDETTAEEDDRSDERSDESGDERSDESGDERSDESVETEDTDATVSESGDSSDTDSDGEATDEPEPAGSELEGDQDDEDTARDSEKAEDGAETDSDDPQADGGARMRPANRSAAAFVLADGAGGHDAGDVASYIATTIVCENLANVAVRAARADPSPFDVDVVRRPEKPTPAELRGAIEDAIVAAHQAIIANAAQSGVGAYTTVVAGIVADGKLHYGWVGDSRAYLVNDQREEIYRLTRDHAVVDEMSESGQLDEIEARIHPRGNQVTRALGGTGTEDPAEETVPVETETVPLYAEDALLVTSDGLIDAQTDAPQLHEEYVEQDGDEEVTAKVRESIVTDDEIRDWVLGADSLGDAAATLVERANARGGKDNISTLLVRDETCPETPTDADLSLRDVTNARPIEDRETVIVDGE